ncbi:hypothetical protein WA158_006859, partial [Blastocystis sp. Blastoise]
MKDAIIRCFEQHPEDIKTLLKTLDVKISTARSIFSKSRNPRNDSVPTKTVGRPIKVTTDEIKSAIIKMVDEDPAITLRKIKGTLVNQFPESQIPSITTIHRVLEGLLYTSKKIQLSPCDRNTERTIGLRKEFTQWFSQNSNAYNFVYVDEAGFNLWEKRTFGRSIKGQPAILVVDGQRFCNVSLVLGISSISGYVYHQFFKNSVGSDSFKEFLIGLCDKLNMMHTNKPCCVILDNCSIHKTTEILDVFREKNKARESISSFDWSKEHILAEAQQHQMNLTEYRYFLIQEMVKFRMNDCMTIENVLGWERHSIS